MKIIINSIITICAIIAISCTPDQFHLNEDNEFPIDGLIMSDLNSVAKLKANEINISESGVAALRSVGLTQLHADLTTQLISGEGLSLYFRTVSNEYDNHPSIKFDYTTSGCKVFENNKLLAVVDSVKAKVGQYSRVHIRNDGVVYVITVDCDTVIKSRTYIPTTEYLILSSMKNSNVRISGINFDEEYYFGKMKE